MRCGQVVSVKTYELHLSTLLIVRKKKIACHQFSLCASLHRLLSKLKQKKNDPIFTVMSFKSHSRFW